MPSLIKPVLISGPFCNAVISINPRQSEAKQKRDKPYQERWRQDGHRVQLCGIRISPCPTHTPSKKALPATILRVLSITLWWYS